jgi:ATP-dependent exoDNAse (exonuclease V) beta subunit
MTPPTFLAKLNPHPKDEFITFQEEGHKYFINGINDGLISVTGFVHQNFEHFDTNSIADKLLKNTKKMCDPNYKYFGKTKEEMIEEWNENGRIASELGTALHADIENFYNQIKVENDSLEFQYFRKFVSDFPELVPYRTEWMVYDDTINLTGSIDMVFENPDGTLQIYDWKRSKGIEYESFGNKCSITPCLSHLPDTNFNHYSLQLNIYRKILQDKYDKIVTKLCLVILHPDHHEKTYECIDVPIMDTEIDELFTLRKQQIE